MSHDKKMQQLFGYVLAFDVNADGYIDAAELKMFLEAVGGWGSESAYTDENWEVAWPSICKMLGDFLAISCQLTAVN